MKNIMSHTIDASKYTLGRLASEAAKILIGKRNADFQYNMVCGDKVVIENAAKVRITGRKLEQKKYITHSGYLGNLKSIDMKSVFAKRPDSVIKNAVSGMLPKNKLRKEWLKNLTILSGTSDKGEK